MGALFSFQETRWTARTLLRRRSSSAVTVTSLALGIGAIVAVFSLVYAILLRPLPYANPERLVLMRELRPGPSGSAQRVSPGTFLDWAEHGGSFDAMAAWRTGFLTLQTERDSEDVDAAAVTGAFFRTLGVTPALGRAFDDEDVRRGEPVVVVSDGFWQRRLGADRAIVGTSLRLEGVSRRIVGVMRRDFAMPSERTELWTPLNLELLRTMRDQRFLGVVARIRETTSLAEARSQSDVVETLRVRPSVSRSASPSLPA